MKPPKPKGLPRGRSGGRKKLKPKDKRVNLIARVKPETKKAANKNAKARKLSLGKYLDEIIE